MLTPSDPPPYRLQRGAHPGCLVVCDHASAVVPATLAALGLPAEALHRHIAIDIGARWAAERIAARLGATLVTPGYSRLVIDCNRYPNDPASMTRESDRIPVPGNGSLDRSARLGRVRELFLPYQRAIAAELDRLSTNGRRPVFLSIHSCTPELGGVRRPWHIGLSYVPPGTLSRACLERLRRDPALCVGDNQPYSVDPAVDYTTPEHALRRGLHYIQVEFRQDLVAEEAAAHAWADRFADALVPAMESVRDAPPEPMPMPWPAPHTLPEPDLLLAQTPAGRRSATPSA